MHIPQDFMTTANTPQGFIPVEVIVVDPHGEAVMGICTPQLRTYITKAQAMAFFNLVDPMDIWE